MQKDYLELQKGIIYGPVLSRRLGRSMGVNVLSPYRKICSFDCMYCHYGKTGLHSATPPAEAFYSSEEILREVEIGLKKFAYLDHVTFSGNGEPTLHPEFEMLVSEIRKMTQQLRPEVRIALFSNSSTLSWFATRASLQWIDVPIFKLDAADQKTFEEIDRPVAGVKIETIVEDLKNCPGIILQTLIVEGEMSNVKSEPFGTWLDAVREIKPRAIQLYSADWSIPGKVINLPLYRLNEIAEYIKTQVKLPVEVF